MNAIRTQVRLRRTAVDGVYEIVLDGRPAGTVERYSRPVFRPGRRHEVRRVAWRRKRLDGTVVIGYPTRRSAVEDAR